jgi:hypothetical protein
LTPCTFRKQSKTKKLEKSTLPLPSKPVFLHSICTPEIAGCAGAQHPTFFPPPAPTWHAGLLWVPQAWKAIALAPPSGHKLIALTWEASHNPSMLPVITMLSSVSVSLKT